MAFANAALSHDLAHRFFALAAARGHAQLELQLLETVRTLRNGGPDLSVGDGLAHANDHD
jgi:hypothetical protein